MATKPQILAEKEYTINKLIERVGGNKVLWKKYLQIDQFKNSIVVIENRVNLFKFKMIISEEEFKSLFLKEKLINKRTAIITAKIVRGTLPLRKAKT